MNQLQKLKALRPVVRSKRLRLAREEAALDRDIQVAYTAMVERVVFRNVAACAFAPRASPVVH